MAQLHPGKMETGYGGGYLILLTWISTAGDLRGRGTDVKGNVAFSLFDYSRFVGARLAREGAIHPIHFS
jgi:hypothetical protein